MIAPRTVGILGGMGPAAGAAFVAQFVTACQRRLHAVGAQVTDQSYPPHWLLQMPFPDRTAALLDHAPSPLPGMVDAVQRLSAVGAGVIAIACNTAHAWHAELQAGSPGVELLHIVEQTVAHLRASGTRDVGLMATTGTHRTRLYEHCLEEAGIRCHVPRADEQAIVMRGIRSGVKAGRMDLASDCFEQVAAALARRHRLGVIVLACTEIPLALESVPGCEVELLDPAVVLADVLARRAYERPAV